MCSYICYPQLKYILFWCIRILDLRENSETVALSGNVADQFNKVLQSLIISRAPHLNCTFPTFIGSFTAVVAMTSNSEILIFVEFGLNDKHQYR